jgi:hypothetical protein
MKVYLLVKPAEGYGKPLTIEKAYYDEYLGLKALKLKHDEDLYSLHYLQEVDVVTSDESEDQ